MIAMGEALSCVPPAHRTADLRRTDTLIRSALEHADTDALRRLRYTTMTGRAPWQVLAGAACTDAFNARTHRCALHTAPAISWSRT